MIETIYIFENVIEAAAGATMPLPVFGRTHGVCAVVLDTQPNLYLDQIGVASRCDTTAGGSTGLPSGRKDNCRISLSLSVDGGEPVAHDWSSGRPIRIQTVHVISAVRDILARTRGVIESAVLTDSHIAFFGCGSVAGDIARPLVQSGVGRVTLIDDGVVSPENVSRYVTGLDAVGVPKVKALGDVLRLVNPAVTVNGVDARLTPETYEAVATAMDGVRLAIVATDSVRANLFAQELTWNLGIPTVFIGMYERAMGGEIFWSVPGMTACYHCMRAGLLQPEPRSHTHMDYATADGPPDLKAEPGLSVDVGIVALAAAKQVLAYMTGRVGRNEALDFERPLMLVGNQAEWIFSESFQFSRVGVVRTRDCWVCKP